METSAHDRELLRRLAERQAEIAAQPVHAETGAEWDRLNGLRVGRPMVWINEIPWHEMETDDGELALQTTDPFCRPVEQALRRTIYQWQHMPADMVVESVFYSPLVVRDSGFGIAEEAETIAQHERGGINSSMFRPQIDSERDVDKIRIPEVEHDQEASEENYQRLDDLFGDILSIEKRGIVHVWFAPWDLLVRWWNAEKALFDLAARPGLVHAAMERLLEAHLERLRQWWELDLLDLTNGNYRVGSGGLGYSHDLPRADYNGQRIRPHDQWGCATAQIFSEVSPSMHEEFALHYEMRWLENFGLNYYGCCEQLHHKLDMLDSVPNLRKVSMSPRADLAAAAPKMAGKYVVSLKPNPAILATETWEVAVARADLESRLAEAEGCEVEIIMKDISTVRDEPERLWEWAEMAKDVAESAAVPA